MRIRLLAAPDLGACLAAWPFEGVDTHVASTVLAQGLADTRLLGAVIEDPVDGQLLGFGISGFLAGSAVEQAAARREPLVASVLASEMAGTPLLVRPDDLRQQAAKDELHLLVLAYRQRTFDPADPLAQELLNAGHSAFRLLHDGYRVRGVWQEGDETDAAWLNAGGMHMKRAYTADRSARRILFGAVREDQDSVWPSHTVSFLFRERDARLGLTHMQRRVSSLALWNLNDAQIAGRLGISAETVRQHWRGIYERVAKTQPGIVGQKTTTETHIGRGAEKRGSVLEFLRSNLHEIRPTS